MITTVRDLIEELGGTAAVETICGVGKTAVSNWRVADALSREAALVLYRECQARGLKVDSALFDRRRVS